MTRPMSEEERESAVARARRVIVENEPRSVSYSEPRRHETLLMARALLSTSSAEREALELVRISNGWRYMADETKAIVIAALSGIEPGEDEQARGQGRSAPISTDTKGTTK